MFLNISHISAAHSLSHQCRIFTRENNFAINADWLFLHFIVLCSCSSEEAPALCRTQDMRGLPIAYVFLYVSVLLNTMFMHRWEYFSWNNLLFYLFFFTVVPSNSCVFLSCRPFVVNTTFSTGLVGVEVCSVSWLGQLTVEV